MNISHPDSGSVGRPKYTPPLEEMVGLAMSWLFHAPCDRKRMAAFTNRGQIGSGIQRIILKLSMGADMPLVIMGPGHSVLHR